jgi:preprotein translocase subunit YajC
MNASPLIFLVLMVAVLWLLLIRPQRQRQAAHRQLLEDLKPGQEVVTLGGLIGRVSSMAEDHLVLEVAPNTEVRVARQAVTGVLGKDQDSSRVTEGPG